MLINQRLVRCDIDTCVVVWYMPFKFCYGRELLLSLHNGSTCLLFETFMWMCMFYMLILFQHSCHVCGRSFKSDKSLGAHQRQAHQIYRSSQKRKHSLLGDAELKQDSRSNSPLESEQVVTPSQAPAKKRRKPNPRITSGDVSSSPAVVEANTSSPKAVIKDDSMAIVDTPVNDDVTENIPDAPQSSVVNVDVDAEVIAGSRADVDLNDAKPQVSDQMSADTQFC